MGVGSGSYVLPELSGPCAQQRQFSARWKAWLLERSGSDVVKISCTTAARKMQWGGGGESPPAPEPVFKMNQVHALPATATPPLEL